MTTVEDAEKIRLQDRLEIFRRHRLDCGEDTNASVIHQYINTATLRFDFTKHSLHLFVTAHIALISGGRQFFRCGFNLIFLTGRYEDISTLANQRMSYCSTNALGTTGNQANFAVYFHYPLSFSRSLSLTTLG